MEKEKETELEFDFEHFINKADKIHFQALDQSLLRTERFIVCKHWLRGLCKRGDDCEFLHVYDHRMMPVCYFWSKYERCSNDDCPFQHPKKGKKENHCPWFVRGFCKHGEKCRRPHNVMRACPNYIAGFCPFGPNCELGHPKFDLPEDDYDTASILKKNEFREILQKGNVELQKKRQQQNFRKRKTWSKK
ncbi:cleavage and polyadenylation specificity factor subunit 4-related [Anaeramoeba flamelloides]|uniref:Cleavage and polyadenylation specificity factor subunit 4-related n=1 Tax=Anaeramoeba flamelloides TaxID=1746091 RepID=A0ABQ8YMS6_9EUKA|nr:cleavage and polyadenylation specificity factor subunit 4-related [Anaeramoeba flamelloides]